MGGMLLCVLVVFMLFGLIAIFLPQSRFSLKVLSFEIFFEQTKPSQDPAHGVGSSWGFDLLCLLGVRHSGEVGERDILGRFLVCLMIMRFLPTLRFCRPFIILGEPSIVSIIFPDDDWRGPQVLDLPRGVHFRSPRHLP